MEKIPAHTFKGNTSKTLTLTRPTNSEAAQTQMQAAWAMGAEMIEALYPIYRLAFQAAIRAHDLQHEWYILWLARGSEPELFTETDLARLLPYNTPASRVERLAALQHKQFLAPVGAGFRLTPTGHQAIEHIRRMAQRELSKAELLSRPDSSDLANLLSKLTQAIPHAPQPLDKRAFLCSRWTDTGTAAPAITRIDHSLTELARFREDCHFAAWQNAPVGGLAWETFTTLWRHALGSADELVLKLRYRGGTKRDYAAALLALAELGWIDSAGAAPIFRLTPLGEQVRSAAEEQTDSLFFTPWRTLSPHDLDRLHELLHKLLLTLR